MTRKNKIFNNPRLYDSSSKLIFGDNILCSQFLRDFADVEILKNIQPEDIEDVSERYVPLYSTERDSDTVKKVNISKYIHLRKDENALNLPLYIVFLIEHKSKVEYNVVMQILRYMVYIWEDYEKETEEVVAKIKERKRGMLFDSVTFSFKRVIEEAAAEAAAKAMVEAEEKAEIEKAEVLAKAEAEAKQKEIAENKLRTTKYIAKMLVNGHSDSEIKEALQQEFGFTEEQAEEEYRKAVE